MGKSVSELSQIRGIDDFPIPENIQNLFKGKPTDHKPKKMSTALYENGMSEASSERPISPTSFKESIYETLPRSMKEQQLLVKAKIDEIQETEKRAQKETEKQLKEEEKKQKKEQERAKDQEKRRLKEESKILKKEQDAEQLRLRKMKEEQEKVVKKENEDQLKQQKN